MRPLLKGENFRGSGFQEDFVCVQVNQVLESVRTSYQSYISKNEGIWKAWQCHRGLFTKIIMYNFRPYFFRNNSTYKGGDLSLTSIAGKMLTKGKYGSKRVVASKRVQIKDQCTAHIPSMQESDESMDY